MSKSTRSRIRLYSGVVIIIGLIVLAAYYQEQITNFFALRLWDKGAPGRTVTEFLTAVQKGDQKQADAYFGVADYKPLMKDGKWDGYFIVSQAGRMNFTREEMVSASVPQPTNTEFIYLGQGAATVTIPDGKGKPVAYRLEMKDGNWKITEMRGGHPAPPDPNAPRPTQSPFGGGARGGGGGAGGARPGAAPPGGGPPRGGPFGGGAPSAKPDNKKSDAP